MKEKKVVKCRIMEQSVYGMHASDNLLCMKLERLISHGYTDLSQQLEVEVSTRCLYRELSKAQPLSLVGIKGVVGFWTIDLDQSRVETLEGKRDTNLQSRDFAVPDLLNDIKPLAGLLLHIEVATTLKIRDRVPLILVLRK